MLKITGPGSITTCDGVTRRDFLQVGALGALGCSLADLALATPPAFHRERMGRPGGSMPHGQDAGFLGKRHDPFVLTADPSKPASRVPDSPPPKETGEARLDRRRKLREVIEGTLRNFDASPDAQ